MRSRKHRTAASFQAGQRGKIEQVRRLRMAQKQQELIRLVSTGDVRGMAHEYPRIIKEIRQLAGGLGVKRVPGSDDWFCCQLRDGRSVGYFQRRTDDCLQAALASLCQMPPSQVVDLSLESMIAAGRTSEEIEYHADVLLDQWQQTHGLEMRLRSVLPKTGWWIGVTYSGEAYSDHCLLMRDREVMFDPSRLLPTDEEELAAGYQLDDLYYAITIEGR